MKIQFELFMKVKSSQFVRMIPRTKYKYNFKNTAFWTNEFLLYVKISQSEYFEGDRQIKFFQTVLWIMGKWYNQLKIQYDGLMKIQSLVDIDLLLRFN